MKEWHDFPNFKYFREIEDELYQYAVEHPDEVLDDDTWVIPDGTFYLKLRELYDHGKYKESYRREVEKANRDEITVKFPDRVQEFCEKYPQWKELYYYEWTEEFDKEFDAYINDEEYTPPEYR